MCAGAAAAAALSDRLPPQLTARYPAQLSVPHVDDLLLVERLVRAAPPPPPPSLPGVEPTSSIAFLFLAKDKLDYMEVWQRFFHGADPAHYGIYFHFFDTRYLSSLA